MDEDGVMLCYVWIIAFAKINLPMAITVNKIPVHAVQMLCCGNLLILLIALGKVYYRPYPDIMIPLAALPPNH